MDLISRQREQLARIAQADAILRRTVGESEALVPVPQPRRRTRPPGARHLRAVKLILILLVISGALWHAAQYQPPPRVTHVTAHARRARELDAHADRVDRA